jgi:hypothetical protein
MRTKEKAEEVKEEVAALTKGDYDRLDSVYTRIVNVKDDLEGLIAISGKERGSVAIGYPLSIVNENLDDSINRIGKILQGEV